MAKSKLTGMEPVTHLTGTIIGKRYRVILDDVKLKDKWSPSVLPQLQEDGLGKVLLVEGETRFAFKTSDQATIAFKPDAGQLLVNEFFVVEEDTDSEDVQ